MWTLPSKSHSLFWKSVLVVSCIICISGLLYYSTSIFKTQTSLVEELLKDTLFRDATDAVSEFASKANPGVSTESELDWWWKKTHSPTASSGPIPGTPKDVPHTTDCAVRGFAYAYGRSLLPQRAQFKTLYDALALDYCPGTVRQIPRSQDSWRPPSTTSGELNLEIPVTSEEEGNLNSGVSVLILFVDPVKGKDSHSGNKDKPLLTIHEALARVVKAKASKSQIILREGTYYIPPGKPLSLTKYHSGLTLRNSPGERAIISGAERIHVYRYDWDLVSKHAKGDYSIWSTKLKGIAPFDGLRLSTERMVRAKTPNGKPEQSQHDFISSVKDQVFGNDGKYSRGWFPTTKDVIWTPPDGSSKSSLRVEPIVDEDADDDQHFAASKPIEEIESSPKDWPGTVWPKYKPSEEKLPIEKKIFEPMDGTAGHGSYYSGIYGACSNALHPPVGYFCSKTPPRGAEFTFRTPKGVTLKNSEMIKLNKDAVVVAWRGGVKGAPMGNPRWFNWVWRVADWKEQGDQLKINFDPKVGGNQGAQGSDKGDYFYIENIKSGLDEPGEYFFDPETSELFIVMNGTNARPSGLEDWGLVRTKELIKFVGLQKDPIKNVAIVGIEFRDTALTWFEPHSMPSGGDWTLPKVAAISVKGGIDGLAIRECLFERLDGSAILLEGYTRNVVVEKNEFAWIGASAIISWGKTSNCLNSICTRKIIVDEFAGGPDGRGGNQPRGTKITGNLFRELGVFMKQSAAYFSALSGQSTIEGNVMFNAPRSFINFNDGFLGGDVIRRNLLLNGVRESADHGPINLWDRMPFIWEGIKDISNLFDSGTVIPLTRVFERNFILANHASQAAIDSDDGASYLSTKRNVFVYGGMGLKSDFGGRQHESVGDLYFLVQTFCFLPVPKLSSQPLDLVFKNNTCVVHGASEYAYGSKCTGKQPGVVDVGKNRIVARHGPLKVCDGQALKDHLKKNPDKDPGTVELAQFPTDEQALIWMSELLL